MTTSNLRVHLLTMHEGKLDEEGEGSAAKQARIDHMLPPAVTRGLPYARQKRASDLLTRAICLDLKPFNLVEGRGFAAFVHELEPRFKIPCRKTLTSNVMKLYDTTKSGIRAMLQGEKIALTTDGWTSLATESYVTVTAHFINKEWEMKSIVLDTSELQTAHSAQNVSTCIESILREFNLERESTNYVNAVERYLEITDIPCMAHTINLAPRKGLEAARWRSG